jgi:ATP-binding cassette subfamily F protein 3
MEDYIDFVLGRNQPKGDGKGGTKGPKLDKKAAAAAREAARLLKKKVSDAEAELARLQAQLSDLDRAMFDPASAKPEYAKLTMGALSQRRGEVAGQVKQAEAHWLEASEALEKAA